VNRYGFSDQRLLKGPSSDDIFFPRAWVDAHHLSGCRNVDGIACCRDCGYAVTPARDLEDSTISSDIGQKNASLKRHMAESCSSQRDHRSCLSIVKISSSGEFVRGKNTVADVEGYTFRIFSHRGLREGSFVFLEQVQGLLTGLMRGHTQCLSLQGIMYISPSLCRALQLTHSGF
jgi:hypothetical protein